MKKILTIILLGIFLVTLMGFNVSAESFITEFDNIKNYDDHTKTVDIRNSVLGIPFLQLGQITTATLNTPHNVLVSPGYQKVAEFTIYPKQDYNNILGSFDIYDKSNNNVKVDRKIDVKYFTLDNVEEPVYEERCSSVINGTLLCDNVFSGTKTVKKEVWKDFNGSVKINRPVKVGLFTEVQYKDNIEWIPRIAGVRVPEWATWTAGLSSGIVSFWTFNETSGTTAEDLFRRYNGTANQTGVLTSAVGRIDTMADLRTSNGDPFIEIPNGINADITTGNFSVNCWMNVTSFGADERFVYAGSSTSAQDFISLQVNTAPDRFQFGFREGVGGFTSIDANAVSSANAQMITVVRYIDGSEAGGSATAEIWVNGSLKTSSVDGEFDANINLNTPKWYFGGNAYDTNLDYDGYGDECGVWNRTLISTEISDLWNAGAGINPTSLLQDADPIVTTLYPANTTNFTVSSINDNATVSDDQNVSKVEFYVNSVLNQTNQSAGVYNNSVFTFNVALGEGTHTLQINATDNATTKQSTLGDLIYVNVDLFNPLVSLDYPTNTTYTLNYTNESTVSVVINATVVDTHLDSCWIEFTNGTNQTITCNTNKTLTGQPFAINTYRVWANDTFGQTNHSDVTATFNYNVFQNSVTNNNPVTEGSTESFSIKFNVSNGLTPSSANVTYNGTDHLATITGSANPYVANASFTVPSVITSDVFNFSWNFLLSDSFYYSSEVFNQTVNPLGVDDCSSHTNVIYNFSVVDEANQTLLTTPTNATVEINLDIFNLDRSTEILNYSNISVGKNPVAVCLNSALISSTAYSIDTIVKYEATGYSIEYYNIENFTASNSTIPQNITLYDLITSDTTEFQITFKDSSFIAVEGALVHINRQYLSENNTFKTVELPKTDSNGQTLGHFVEKDVIYNILVTNGTSGEVLGTFNNIIAFCQDATIGDCVINLNALSSGEQIFDYDSSLGVSITTPTYNGTSRIVSLDFVTTDGAPATVNLSAIKYDQLGNDTACSNTVTSASGSISCTVPAGFGNSSLQLFIYVDGNLIIQDYVAIDTNENFGDAGFLILLFMILTLVMMFIDSKTGILMSLIIGMIAGGSYSLIIGDAIGVGASILWLVIAIGIMVWKLNKDKN